MIHLVNTSAPNLTIFNKSTMWFVFVSLYSIEGSFGDVYEAASTGEQLSIGQMAGGNSSYFPTRQ